MPTYVTPKKNTAFVFYLGLLSQANNYLYQVNPTLADGDVQVAIDDGGPNNLTVLPVVDADFTKRVKVSLSAAEMNGDNITVIFSDVAGAEWCDQLINIQTTAQQIDDLATSFVLNTGTSPVAGAVNQITLAASALAVAGSYVHNMIVLTGGTGAGQARLITAYSAGRVATVVPNWDVTPANDTVYQVLPIGQIHVMDYLTGKDPATLVLATPANKLATDGTGRVTLVPTQIVVKKNTALSNFMFVMNSATTHAPTPGLTVTATRSVDGGAFAAAANVVVELSNGWYSLNMAASDLNGSVIAWRMTAALADTTNFTILTQP